MVLILDLRPVGDRETDLAKGADNLVRYLRERMELAERAAAARQGEINGFLGQGGFQFQFGPAIRERDFQFKLGRLDQLPGGRLFVLAQRAKVYRSGRRSALLAGIVAVPA